VRAALRHGLTPIMCIGEGLEVRKAGEHVPYTLAQIDGGLAGLEPAEAAQVVFAYEPIWAIGTGEVATPDDAQEVCAAIRGRLAELYDADLAAAARILYGGSVKAANAAGLMAQPDVDGGLVGGASIDAEEWAGVCTFPKHLTV
jgi:triosephosphate isomerase